MNIHMKLLNWLNRSAVKTINIPLLAFFLVFSYFPLLFVGILYEMGNIDSADYSENNKIANLIKSRGYPVDIHTVTTEDGFIITLYRIKHGKKNITTSYSKNNVPVLLIHGLLGCCTEWLNEENGLGYFLADHEFDVWIGNCRGTTYSRNHVLLDCEKDRNEYWDFSWHEIGYYDIPAFINFILKTTKFSKILYIGYSQGTTAFMVLMSSRCDYNAKVCLCIMLAPSALYENSEKLRYIQNSSSIVLKLMLHFRGHSKIPLMSTLRKLGKTFSAPDSSRKIIFDYIYFYLSGEFATKEQMTKINFQRICENSPNDASIKQAIHYTQIIRDGPFKRYDYGCDKNKVLYGSDTPPPYDLSKISVPVALFIGKSDIFCQPKDADTLANLLGNVVHKHIVQREDFRHMDFIYSHDVITLLYGHMLQIMEQYKPINDYYN